MTTANSSHFYLELNPVIIYLYPKHVFRATGALSRSTQLQISLLQKIILTRRRRGVANSNLALFLTGQFFSPVFVHMS